METEQKNVEKSIEQERVKSGETSKISETEKEGKEYTLGTNLVLQLQTQLKGNSPITPNWLLGHLNKAILLAANPGLVNYFNNNFEAAKEFVEGTWSKV